MFAIRQVQSLQAAGIVTREFSLESRGSLTGLLRQRQVFRRVIADFCPHVVHAHYGSSLGLFTVLCSPVPTVVTFRGSDLNGCASVSWLRSALSRFMSQVTALRADSVICVSPGLRSRLWQSRYVRVIPTGIDLHLFHPLPQDLARAQLGWSKNEKVVLFNATTEPVHKGLPLAYAAVRHAESLCGPIRFVVLNGTLAAEGVCLRMNAADCLLLASKSEGSPNIVKEALACNLPVVSLDVGDVRDLLAGVTFSSVVPRSVARMGEALAAVMRAPGRSNGRQAVANLSVEVICERIISVYQQSISDSPR